MLIRGRPSPLPTYAGHFLVWSWVYLPKHDQHRSALTFLGKMFRRSEATAMQQFVLSVLSAHKNFAFDLAREVSALLCDQNVVQDYATDVICVLRYFARGSVDSFAAAQVLQETRLISNLMVARMQRACGSSADHTASFIMAALEIIGYVAFCYAVFGPEAEAASQELRRRKYQR